MKKTILIGILIISFLFVGCEFPEENVGGQKETITKTQRVEPKQIGTEEKIYGVGESPILEDIEYYSGGYIKRSVIGNEFMQKEPSGKYIIVVLTFMNMDNKPKDLFMPYFTLIDTKSREFSVDSEATTYLSFEGIETITFEQLQPQLLKAGAVVFDIPKDITDFKLKIKNNKYSSKYVLLEIEEV